MESDIYSPVPKEPTTVGLLTEDAAPTITSSQVPNGGEADECLEMAEESDDEDDLETPPETSRKSKNLALMVDLLRRSDGPIKARALANVAQPKIKVGTFRNHYKKDLERLGMKNDGSGYYLPKVVANTGT